jgi:hypothetical protein
MSHLANVIQSYVTEHTLDLAGGTRSCILCEISGLHVRTMKNAFFWDVTPFILVEGCQHLRRTCCLHFQSGEDSDGVVGFSRMSVKFYQITWCHIPEDSILQYVFYSYKHRCDVRFK